MIASTRTSVSITNINVLSSAVRDEHGKPSSITKDDDVTSSTSTTSFTGTSMTQQRNDDKVSTSDDLQQHPSLRSEAWSEISAQTFNVRGKTYMEDRIKQPSEESAFQLLAIDLINTEKPIYNGLCAHPDERVQKAIRQEKLGASTTNNNNGFKMPEFIFAINLCIPNDKGFYHSVFYFGATKERMDEIRNRTTPFGRVMNKFIYENDNDEYRNKSLKLIPRVVDGNFIIKRAVGTKPAILGRDMKQSYVKGDRYMEVIVDITSNHIANGITKLCLGYINNLSIDMMFVIEGHDESTLPERILGGARISHLDFNTKDGKRTVIPE